MNKLILLSLAMFLFSNCGAPNQKAITEGSFLEVSDANFHNEILKKENVSVVYFWAVWCGPCKITAPVFKELAETEIGNTTYGKVNVDENPLIIRKYGIRSIPAVLFFKNGQEVDRHVGVFSKELIGNKVKAQM